MIDTITRSQLIEVAERSLEQAQGVLTRALMGPLPLDLAKGVMKVAQEAPRIAGDSQWWNERTQCGCLVGTLNKRASNSGLEMRIGLAYLDALVEVLGWDRSEYAEVIEVVDDF